MNFLPLPSAHERRLGALIVNVGPEVLHAGFGRLLGLLDRRVNCRLGVLVELLLKNGQFLSIRVR